MSHRKGAGAGYLGGIIPQVSLLQSVCGDGSVLLADGTRIANIDDVLLCTGYIYTYPFLDGESGVRVGREGRALHGLVSYCIALKLPTLSFVGLPCKVIPFPMFEDQALFIASVLSGEVDYGKLQEINRIEEKDARTLQIERSSGYYLEDRQWEYRRKLASLSHGPMPTPSTIEVYCDSRAARKNSPHTFREREYEIFGDGPGEWRVFEHGEDITGRDDPGVQIIAESIVE